MNISIISPLCFGTKSIPMVRFVQFVLKVTDDVYGSCFSETCELREKVSLLRE